MYKIGEKDYETNNLPFITVAICLSKIAIFICTAILQCHLY